MIYCDIIIGSGTDPILLLVLFFLLGWPSSRCRRFRSDRDEIWQDYSSSK